LETETDGATKQLLEKIAFVADAVVTMHTLRDAAHRYSPAISGHKYRRGAGMGA
jgi:hypothetical protein